MKYILKKKFENYQPKQGTIHEGVSKCQKSDAEETNIYKCIEKYGMGQILQQTQASQPMYLDNRLTPKTLDETLKLQEECYKYFEQMPARARKVFEDNKEIFYQKYIRGEFADFLTTGALDEEMISQLKIEHAQFINSDLEGGKTNEQLGKDSTSSSSINTNGTESNN